MVRFKLGTRQEKQADRIGIELALCRGFDPEEAARFWDRQHEPFGKRRPSTRIVNSLFGADPTDRIRAEQVRALVAEELEPAIDEKRAGDGHSAFQ